MRYAIRWCYKDTPETLYWSPSEQLPETFLTVKAAEDYTKAFRFRSDSNYNYWFAEYPSGNKVAESGDNESTSLAARPKPTPAVRDVFPADWRAWRDHGKAANECACGINRAQCDYHRD